MFRKIFLLSLLIFSLSYAVDEIDIEKNKFYFRFFLKTSLNNF